MQCPGTIEDIKHQLQEIAIAPDLGRPFFEIEDFTQVDNLEFGDYRSDQLINEYIGLAKKGHRGAIFITGNEYGQGDRQDVSSL